MSTRNAILPALLGVLSLTLAAPVMAQAQPAQGAATAAPLPPGHPQIGAQADGDDDDDGDEELPPGHPAAAAPQGGGAAHAMPSADRLPEDTSVIDKSIAGGTIEIQVLDAKEMPIPNAPINLGIMRQSVAKGESHQQKAAQSDASGKARFTGLEIGSDFAYRVTVPWSRDPNGRDAGVIAMYDAPPFQLDLAHGERVAVHVYPVTSRLEDSLVAMQGFAYVELKDDVLQVNELFRAFNFGSTTWVPKETVFDLPKKFKAFNAQKEMSDVGVDPVEGRGARLRGTISPGQHEISFRYQIPYNGNQDFDFSLGLPPRVARMRVISEATRHMQLEVAGFPKSVSDHNGTGQRVLVTERQMRGGDAPLKSITVSLRDLPGHPAGPVITVILVALTVAGGIWAAFASKKTSHAIAGLNAPPEDLERARTLLAHEIAELERARAEGQIGPTAYSRLRQTLVDALGRVLSATA